MSSSKVAVAYFSMEIAFDSHVPNYAGGLGVLAADTLYSCADLGIPMVGVSLIYHQDDDSEKAFNFLPYMKKLDHTISVEIEDRSVNIAVWQRDMVGASGKSVPVYFLSSYVPENNKWDRDITKYLYAADRYTRLGQEIILGVGGYRALHQLGYENISCYHMNEGHAALVGLERLRAHGGDVSYVQSKAVFTTHTPVPAGHDYFDYDLARKTLGKLIPDTIQSLATPEKLGMTQLAMNLSRTTNSVSLKHRDVCRDMFPGRDIENVTNAVYHPRWVGTHMQRLFDDRLDGWRERPELFEHAVKKISSDAVMHAHAQEKKECIQWINAQRKLFPFSERTEDDLFSPEWCTVGFARRFVPYKRPDLLFRRLDQLRDVGYRKLQLVFACHCHPDDAFCMNLYETIGQHARELRGQVRVVIIPEYSLDIAARLVRGVDVWLNNPIPPREASGTSGMKAAMNGVLNCSIADGWWIEGYERAPLSGWSFAPSTHQNADDDDAQSLMQALERVITCFTTSRDEWSERMKHAISLGAHFTTHRLVREYEERIWKTGRE